VRSRWIDAGRARKTEKARAKERDEGTGWWNEKQREREREQALSDDGDLSQARCSAHRTVDGRHYLARFVPASKYSLFVCCCCCCSDDGMNGQSPLIYFSERYPPRPQAAARSRIHLAVRIPGIPGVTGPDEIGRERG